jgi:hypothetical protein
MIFLGRMPPEKAPAQSKLATLPPTTKAIGAILEVPGSFLSSWGEGGRRGTKTG